MHNKEKTLLFHDTFLMKGGAERMNIEIAKILDADIATSIWDKDCYNPEEFDFEGKIIQIQPNFRKWMFGFLKMKLAFIFAKNCNKITIKNYCKNSQKEKNDEKWDIQDYKNVFLSNEAISVIWSLKKEQKTIYYAHSISRHLFDLYDEYLKKVPKIVRIPYKIMAYFLRKLYIKELQQIDIVLTNSPANQKRLKEWCNIDSQVLFPPVSTEHFYYRKNLQYRHICKNWHLESKNYFISFARLTHAKWIYKIIEAFKNLPDKNILILFGKNDSQREEFMQLAKIIPSTKQDEIITSQIYPNISFLSLVDNAFLPELISHSLATICMSQNEDFGMVAIESMACGIPVIAPNEGWYKETILHEKTGILLEDNTSKCLHKIIQSTYKEAFQNMNENCKQQADIFSLQNFKNQLLKIIS